VNADAAAALRLCGIPYKHSFFGYYDLCPFDRTQQKLLAHAVPLDAAPASVEAEIGYFRLDTNGAADFVRLGKTAAWCWQQGSRLQWLPGQDDLVFCNGISGNVQRGLVLDGANGSVQQQMARPVYDITQDGRTGIALNFSRLQRLRPGYGYQPGADTTIGQPAPEADGLWIINMANGQDHLLFSLAQAACFAPHDSMQNAEHYFNHVKWNPTGSRFLVFHLWRDSNGRRHSRALTLDAAGEVRAVSNSRHVSHYWWADDDHLLLYGTPVDCPAGYYLHRDAHEAPPVAFWGDFLPHEDGHPSIAPNDRRLVTDTLPDHVSERRLLIGDLQARTVRQLAAFYSPPGLSGETRCDLHPRWSPAGDMVAVDTAHAGYRQIALLTTQDPTRA
jgi:hypothetical protein